MGRVVSHETAGALWGLEVNGSLHGIRAHGRRIPGITDHELALIRSEWTELAAMRVTTPLRTITDLLCGWPEEPAVGMVTDALRRRLITPADLGLVARAARGRTGVNRVREMADSCMGEPWSTLEWRFQRAAHELGPGWRFNVPIVGMPGPLIVADALHEPSATIVELDGKRFHGGDRFQHDRTRDQRLAAAGYLVVRITWDDLADRMLTVMSRLAQTVGGRERLARLSDHPASGTRHAVSTSPIAG